MRENNSSNQIINQQNKQKLFDTQFSQQGQNHSQDKGFSPWIRQKTIVQHDYSPQQLDYHRFLANIRLSPKNKRKSKNPAQPEDYDELQILKADLQSKIKAQKINNGRFIDEKQKNRSFQCKTFFQRRANLSKLYRRPKSIQLSLQLQPRSMLKCSPLKNQSNISNIEEMFPTNVKPEHKTIHKLRKKKVNPDQDKIFSQTSRDFKLDIIATQKKMYQTLQISILSAGKKSKKIECQNSQNLMTKNTAIVNRPKFLRTKPQRPIFEFNDTLACLGKNALTLEHRSCKQKIKFQQWKLKGNNNENFII